MIKFRTFPAIPAGNPRRKQCDPKSQRPEQRGERAIQLIAEATTVTSDNLANKSFLIERDFAGQRNIEIFKRNGQEMCAMDRAQTPKVGAVEPV